MKLPNLILNYKENLNIVKNFFVSISKEMVTGLWVLIVLLLIIWSYIESEYKGISSTELNIYQISISESLEID